MLDFTPNAVHSGIYAAQRQGFYRDAGVDLTIRQPGESTDAPKLLAAGRADFAILDIHDLGIAREHGLDLVGMMPIVQRPLAAVLARGDGPVRRPRELDGRTVGVTGLPSDEAVVDSEVSADGGDPGQVDRVTIGFNAVAALAAGKVDAATGFWNAEGVALRRQGVPIRIFKVDRYGAPPYPELILVASRKTSKRTRSWSKRWSRRRPRGYELAVAHPERALDDLLAEVPGLDRGEQAAQLARPASRPAPRAVRPARCSEPGRRWDLEHGLLERPLDVQGSSLGARLAAMSLAADFSRCSTRCRPTGPTSNSICESPTRAATSTCAVALSQVNARPYSKADWDWRLLVAHSFGHAAAAETRQGRAGEARCRRRRRRDAGARGARGPLRGRADVGPAGERSRGVPPAPLDLALARVVAISSDLLLGSKVEAMLRRRRPRGDARAGPRRAPPPKAPTCSSPTSMPGSPEALVGSGHPRPRLLLPRQRRDEAGCRRGRRRPRRPPLPHGPRTAPVGRPAI